ncbi:hypothetical protein K443DRAFT_12010 [Laccaria amethystina LaAM-08-1]|uniref:Unplaced genomic scaffold K443scaffold_252, whole genome shotgun sequence n=1 Tax=Laccaria amethystina LaAM-08-1 TaxID=1095629 RepID=A0A0C9WSE4_9AGAR|nr:hypothetical protein K443DRAFT_12010 [Laccaria amethystina LaAM-08-1]
MYVPTHIKYILIEVGYRNTTTSTSSPSAAPNTKPTRITSTGNASLFHGVPDWVYEEEFFPSDPALWRSPTFHKLLSFDETLIEEFKFPMYNPTEDANGVIPYTTDVTTKYPKPPSCIFDLGRYLEKVADLGGEEELPAEEETHTLDWDGGRSVVPSWKLRGVDDGGRSINPKDTKRHFRVASPEARKAGMSLVHCPPLPESNNAAGTRVRSGFSLKDTPTRSFESNKDFVPPEPILLSLSDVVRWQGGLTDPVTVQSSASRNEHTKELGWKGRTRALIRSVSSTSVSPSDYDDDDYLLMDVDMSFGNGIDVDVPQTFVPPPQPKSGSQVDMPPPATPLVKPKLWSTENGEPHTTLSSIASSSRIHTSSSSTAQPALPPLPLP